MIPEPTDDPVALNITAEVPQYVAVAGKVPAVTPPAQGTDTTILSIPISVDDDVWLLARKRITEVADEYPANDMVWVVQVVDVEHVPTVTGKVLPPSVERSTVKVLPEGPFTSNCTTLLPPLLKLIYKSKEVGRLPAW